MKNLITPLLLLLTFSLFAQQDSLKISKEKFLKEASSSACLCIDSVNVYNRSKKEVASMINKCIDKEVMMYSLSSQLSASLYSKKKDSVTNIVVNTNPESDGYQQSYFEIERYLMKNCSSIKSKINVNEKQSQNSVSTNPQAVKWYNKGYTEVENKNYKGAIKYFKKALKVDKNYAFAWDAIGINYRRLKQYDKAINAYENSLKLDPYGKLPLQNIAIVYVYTKEYDKAIEAYNRLAEVDSDNPEVFYGVGIVLFNYKNDNEGALQNLCKAYMLYVKQKSPYRTDAEKVINQIFTAMKKEGKEERFNAILKENNINTN